MSSCGTAAHCADACDDPGSASSAGQPLASLPGSSAPASAQPSGTPAARPPILTGASSTVNARIQELKKLQAEQREAKKRVAKYLRNEERTKRRLKERTKQLTDEDLLPVMRLREDARRSGASRPLETDESSSAGTPVKFNPAADIHEVNQEDAEKASQQ